MIEVLGLLGTLVQFIIVIYEGKRNTSLSDTGTFFVAEFEKEKFRWRGSYWWSSGDNEWW